MMLTKMALLRFILLAILIVTEECATAQTIWLNFTDVSLDPSIRPLQRFLNSNRPECQAKCDSPSMGINAFTFDSAQVSCSFI